MSRLKLRLARFMRVKPICNFVFSIRFFYYMRVLRRFQAYEGGAGVEKLGREHNFRSIFSGDTSDRILKLVMPLSVIDRLNENSKIVAIGCRYETDLLYLNAYGFKSENVRGFDLFSYSPWVDVGDMHAMSYADSSWDAALLGWVIIYSSDPQTAAREVVRVVRPGGLVAIGFSTYPQEQLDRIAAKEGGLMGSAGKIVSTDDIVKLFGESVDHIYFRHDRSDRSKQGHSLIVFSIKK
jgi:SAM-dependent methyltransferase